MPCTIIYMMTITIMMTTITPTRKMITITPHHDHAHNGHDAHNDHTITITRRVDMDMEAGMGTSMAG